MSELTNFELGRFWLDGLPEPGSGIVYNDIPKEVVSAIGALIREMDSLQGTGISLGRILEARKNFKDGKWITFEELKADLEKDEEAKP